MVHSDTIVGLKKNIEPLKVLIKFMGKGEPIILTVSLSNWSIRLRNSQEDLTHLVIYRRKPNMLAIVV